MRILMTTDTVGGVWSFTQELVSGLLKRGSSICLVSLGRFPNAEQTEWAESLQTTAGECFEYHSLDVPLEWMDENGRSYAEAAPHLLALGRSFRAELIHSNQFCFGALPTGLPILVTAHSDVLSWADACRGGELPDTPWLQRYRVLAQAGLDGAQSAVAPTRWMLDALRSHFNLPADAKVIPNGRTMPPSGSDANRKLQAVTAGRLWDEAKNLRLLEAVELPMPLLVAGEAEFDAVQPAKMPANLTFVGCLSNYRLTALFGESAAYVCTSRYEPFGLAPLEAALAGCAVLAHDIPSLREVWGDGALFFAGAEELTALLRRLAKDPVSLAAAQKRSQERALLYSADRMADAYRRQFLTVLSRREAFEHVA